MLKEFLKDHRLYHTEPQIDYYITTKAGGNLWGQYKQAIRELYKRFRGLRESICDRSKLEIEIKEQLIISNTDPEDIKRRYAAVEHTRLVMRMEETERVIEDTKREFKRFYSQACILKKHLGEITEDKRKKLDNDLLLYNLKQDAAIGYSMSGGVSQSTLEKIHSLPKEIRIKFVEDISNKEKTIDWYYKKNEFHFNSIKDIEIDDIEIETCLLEM